jgi:glycosyltransferase involved in cell wall biosynthesis
MDQFYFSIVIGVFNRETIIKRCIDSCLDQIFPDFEIVVVDDGSTDKTLDILNQIHDPRLRIIKHSQNRGISPARNTGINNSKGKWIVGVDSDWALFPHSLQRLYELTNSLDENIIAVRARQIWDTGRVAPLFIPKEPIDYIGRIKWVDVEGGSDVLPCYRRNVFDKVTFDPDRRGSLEMLYNLNMARQGLMLYVEDILCMQYSDAPNSTTRGNMKSRVNTLKKCAPDTLWMYLESLRIHGSDLKEYGPKSYITLHRSIGLQYFYLGKKWMGLKSTLFYLSKRPYDLVTWFVMILGLLGPNVALYGNAIRHWLRSFIQKYFMNVSIG